MKEKYLVPDFYEDFHCKCGDCRRPCCVGWDVTLSMREYFSLLGLSCSPDVRKRLDSALLLEKNGSPERYGLLNKNFFGDCPLHGENGYCLLQCEKGEEALAAVCRVYPRSPKRGKENECTLSNSCEGVVEELWKKRTPFSFCERELDFPSVEESPEAESALRRTCLERLNGGAAIKESLRELGEQFVWEKEERVDFLPFLKGVASTFSSFSPDVAPYAEVAWHFLKQEEDYRRKAALLFSRLDGLKGALKNLMVNNAFYKRLPAGEEGRGAKEDISAFLLSYMLLEYLLVGNEAAIAGREQAVDLIADTFRLINHTRFEHNALVLMEGKMGALKDFYQKTA